MESTEKEAFFLLFCQSVRMVRIIGSGSEAHDIHSVVGLEEGCLLAKRNASCRLQANRVRFPDDATFWFFMVFFFLFFLTSLGWRHLIFFSSVKAFSFPSSSLINPGS